ncbi:Replicative DNA helicase [Carnimonas sp. R-84981]|uniref:replicative DNA helicase n=1 Tax=Carnimonas bestiolae TaxID=3402172 RepID=UPI003EDC97E8
MNDITLIESNIIGAVLRDESLMASVQSKLTVHDFSTPMISEAWGVMCSLYGKGESVNVITVSDASNLELTDLAEMAKESYSTSPELVQSWVKVVTNHARKRRLGAGLSHAMTVASKTDTDTDDVLEVLRDTLMSAESSLPRTHRSIVDVVRERINALDARLQGHETAIGIRTGLRDLDRKLYGLNKSEFILLAARPGIGKTAMALQWATYAAIDQSKNVLFFSLEMSADELVDRILIQRSKNTVKSYLNPKKHQVEWEMLSKPVADLRDSSLDIFDDIFDIEGVIAKCREIHRKTPIDVVFIDYLQLMSSRTSKRNGNRVQEISDQSRALKMLAMSLGCPVVALSQLNRDVEKRPNKRPLLADLRESGSLEQDANKVVMLYREEVYNTETTDKNIAEVLVRKNRGGETGTVPVACEMDKLIFHDLAHDYHSLPTAAAEEHSPYA